MGPSESKPGGVPGISIAYPFKSASASWQISAIEKTSYPRILPVKVYTIETIIIQKFRDVGREIVTVRLGHGFAENVVCLRLCRVAPAAKGDDLLLTDGFEVLPLMV